MSLPALSRHPNANFMPPLWNRFDIPALENEFGEVKNTVSQREWENAYCTTSPPFAYLCEDNHSCFSFWGGLGEVPLGVLLRQNTCNKNFENHLAGHVRRQKRLSIQSAPIVCHATSLYFPSPVSFKRSQPKLCIWAMVSQYLVLQWSWHAMLYVPSVLPLEEGAAWAVFPLSHGFHLTPAWSLL